KCRRCARGSFAPNSEIAVMSRRRIVFAFLIASLFMATMAAAHAGALQPVALQDICVTNGEIRTGPDGRLQIDSPSSRAVLRFRSQPVVEIRFTYLGSSAKSPFWCLWPE